LRRERWAVAGVHYGIAERIKIAPKRSENAFSGPGIRGLLAIIERHSLGSVIVRLAADVPDLGQTDGKRY